MTQRPTESTGRVRGSTSRGPSVDPHSYCSYCPCSPWVCGADPSFPAGTSSPAPLAPLGYPCPALGDGFLIPLLQLPPVRMPVSLSPTSPSTKMTSPHLLQILSGQSAAQPWPLLAGNIRGPKMTIPALPMPISNSDHKWAAVSAGLCS